jgi:maltooligosyltrehalose trehalohydrolase
LIDDPDLPQAGLTPIDDQTSRWRIWAPKARQVELILGLGADAERLAMEPETRGFFGVTTPTPSEGTRYAYALDGRAPLPDPTSRWQPDGVHAASAVCYTDRFAWDEGGWNGMERAGLVIYELHVGTFTLEGTFESIEPRINDLLELGVTAIELMPVAQFPGVRSWGYDGVHPFAVQNSYGGPEGLKRLIEVCHRAGMAVLLDVVFNHFGPEGNYLPAFGNYLTEKYKTDWGSALNFDDRHCDAVRALVLDNVRMWIKDYRFDGLRLDAADQIYDRSPRHILAEIAEVAHAEAAKRGRPVHIFAETDQNDAPRYLRAVDRGGYGLDGHWTDDFHHAVHATLTGESNGYYRDFADGPRALAKALNSVFVNDGNYSPFRDRRHGAPATEFAGDRFVAFTQNHDQVGNRMKSDRYASSLDSSAVRLAAGILLLSPRLPLLFMGEDYGETNPFPFFSDFHDPDLVKAVRDGRQKEFAYFGWQGEVPDPFDPKTRDSAVLSWSWDDPVRQSLRTLYRELLKLRRESPVLRDFQLPIARLLTDLGLPQVLEMIREARSGEKLAVYFNLGPESCELPDGLVTGLASFRSERPIDSPEASGGKTKPIRLEGWEFAIYSEL